MARKITNKDKVENIFDLGLVNYVRHPSNPDYIVFRFAHKRKAIVFEECLKEEQIWFEKSSETTKSKTYELFGIHIRDYERVQEINFDVEAKTRNHIIKNNILRWLLLIVMGAIIGFALFGYYTHQSKLKEMQNTLEVNE